ncbi:hypothetical protein TrLO_g1392 [Triparma laevis f. longispina]|uniref:Myb-like domain-containing protein n=1 Tax=Triparma laevis f. longispina TaxID=1714387 RepID=A0A9W7L0G7_9STRA|nr:hypothetical protein TrLO_g1392 [Triparma laevis f. longispina]
MATVKREKMLDEDNLVEVDEIEIKIDIKNWPCWTEEENAALVEVVDEYCLDWDRIKAEASARLGDRKANTLCHHFRDTYPEKYEEWREANSVKWTEKEHGADYKKILKTEKKVLGHRTAKRSQNQAPQELQTITKQ